MSNKHNQKEAVLRCCIVSDAYIGVTYLFSRRKVFKLTLTLPITLWAINSLDMFPEVYNLSKRLQNVILFSVDTQNCGLKARKVPLKDFAFNKVTDL